MGLTRFFYTPTKCGYKDDNGNVVIQPIYSWCEKNFHFGHAQVRIELSDGSKWFYIDKTGEQVYPMFMNPCDCAIFLPHEELGQFDTYGNFITKIAYYKSWDKFGLVSENGKIILAAEFDKIEFDEKHNLIFVQRDGKWEAFSTSWHMLLNITHANKEKMYTEKPEEP